MADKRDEFLGGLTARRSVATGMAATLGLMMAGGRWAYAAAPTPQDRQDLARIEDY